MTSADAAGFPRAFLTDRTARRVLLLDARRLVRFRAFRGRTERWPAAPLLATRASCSRTRVHCDSSERRIITARRATDFGSDTRHATTTTHALNATVRPRVCTYVCECAWHVGDTPFSGHVDRVRRVMPFGRTTVCRRRNLRLRRLFRFR